MNETNNLEKEMAALTETTSISVKDDLITMSFRKDELESILEKSNSFMDKLLKRFQPEKEPEIFIESQKDKKESFMNFYNTFVACTGQEVSPEGFINGMAFTFAFATTQSESKKKNV